MKKQNSLQKTLIDIGLSESEASVYLASLSLGPATMLQISKASEVKRATAYSIIDSLSQKGIMRIEPRGFKRVFAAEPPEKLEALLTARHEQLKNILPELSALYNLKGGEGFIKYYEGLPAVKGVYEDLLRDIRSGEDYLVVGAQKAWHELDPVFFQNFIERRAKLPIKIRLLFEDSKISQEHKKFERNYNENIRILPKTTKLTTNLVITPQKVVIHQLTPPIIAIVIENQSVIRMCREFFEIMWAVAADNS